MHMMTVECTQEGLWQASNEFIWDLIPSRSFAVGKVTNALPEHVVVSDLM